MSCTSSDKTFSVKRWEIGGKQIIVVSSHVKLGTHSGANAVNVICFFFSFFLGFIAHPKHPSMCASNSFIRNGKRGGKEQPF